MVFQTALLFTKLRRSIADHWERRERRLLHAPPFLGFRQCVCGAYAWVPASGAAAA